MGLDVFFCTRGGKNASDGFAEALPLGVLGVELAAAGGGQRVETRAAVFGGGAPGSGDPLFLEEALERGIERAMLDLEGVAGGLLDEFGDGVTVHRSPAKGAEDDEVECALHNFEAVLGDRWFEGHG
jgi:hypothetical protein